MSKARSPTDGPPRQDAPADGKTQTEKIQRQLDDALAASFPASDPVSIVTSHEEEDWGEPENGRTPKASE
jgi:hypothetical protein